MNPNRLNVSIDGFNLALEKGTGVATYGRNLSYVCRDLGHRVDVIYGKPVRPEKSPLMTDIRFFDPPPTGRISGLIRTARRIAPRPFGVPTFRIPMGGDVILRGRQHQLPHFDSIWNATDLFSTAEANFWLTGAMTKVRHSQPVDIAHWTYPMPVRIPGAVNIYTMHDLVPLRLPYTTLDNKSFYLRLMRSLVREADHIVTVSESSRRDIIRLLDCPEDKVTNTYQSVQLPVSLLAKSEEQVRAEIEGAFGLRYKGYLLFFGAIEPKKNVGRVIEAYLSSGVDMPLVLIGSKAWKSDEELRLLAATEKRSEDSTAERSAADRIRHFDYAPLSLLVSAIRGARATVFPSLYEGFGLPILESMLLRTPVVTSKEGATAEIAGDAALLVDPYDVAEIAAALRAIATDDDLADRLTESGHQRAQSFSASTHAARLDSLHATLVAGNRSAAEKGGRGGRD
jgi:glycosyltransferase involved in cell wall biosynthesis